MICSFNFFIFLAVCLNISALINIKILTNSNQQTQSYKFTSHIAAFLSVVLINEMLEICIQTSYDQNVQLILKSYLSVVLGTTLSEKKKHVIIFFSYKKVQIYYNFRHNPLMLPNQERGLLSRLKQQSSMIWMNLMWTLKGTKRL